MAQTPRKRPYEPDGLPVSVDGWTLKCLYKVSDYTTLIAHGDFINLFEERSKPRANGEQTVQAYYGCEADKLVRVKLQWFELADGTITRSGLKEPKWIYYDGASFHLHGGDRWWEKLRRDLTNFKYNSTNPSLIALKRRYADWRRYKCDKFGPVEAWWRAGWLSSRPYRACRVAAERTALTWKRARKATKPLRSWFQRRFWGPTGPALALS